MNDIVQNIALETADRQQKFRDIENNIISRRNYIRQLEEALRFNQGELNELLAERDRLAQERMTI